MAVAYEIEYERVSKLSRARGTKHSTYSTAEREIMESIPEEAPNVDLTVLTVDPDDFTCVNVGGRYMTRLGGIRKKGHPSVTRVDVNIDLYNRPPESDAIWHRDMEEVVKMIKRWDDLMVIEKHVFDILPDIEFDYNSIIDITNDDDLVKQAHELASAYTTNILRLKKPIVHSDDGTLSWCSKSCRKRSRLQIACGSWKYIGIYAYGYHSSAI